MIDLLHRLQRIALGAWRHRWLALRLAWVACLAGWLIVWMLPNAYEASTRLTFDSEAALLRPPHGIAPDSGGGLQIDILQRLLLERANLRAIVVQAGLRPESASPEAIDAAAKGLGGAIKIQQLRRLFTITLRAPSPGQALKTLRTAVAVVIKARADSAQGRVVAAEKLLDPQIAAESEHLRATEARRAAFRAQYADILPSSENGVSRLDAARTLAASLAGQLTDAHARLDQLRQELAQTPATRSANGAGGAARDPLSVAEDRLAQLLETDTEAHPDVINQRRLIATLRGGGAAASTGIRGQQSDPNPVHDQLRLRVLDAQSEVMSLDRRAAAAAQERDRLEAVAREAPGVQARYIDIDRDYTVVRSNYDALVAQRAAVELAAAGGDAAGDRLQVIDPPQVSSTPVTPNRILLLSAILVLGLAGGVGAALALAQSDRSFHALGDLRALGIPVMGAISDFAASAGGRRLHGVATVALATLLLLVVYGGLMYATLTGKPGA